MRQLDGCPIQRTGYATAHSRGRAHRSDSLAAMPAPGARKRRRLDHRDRRGADPARRRRPAARRRRLRGDPALPGAPVRARRAPRPPGALGRGDRAARRPRRRSRGRSTRCSSASARHDGQLRIVVTRGGRRARSSPRTCRRAARPSRSPRSRYSPSVILTGVKSLSYAANMQATRLAQGEGRRRGGPGAPRRDRARGADLDPLLGDRRRRPADAGDRGRDPRVDHPGADRPRARGRGGRVRPRRRCSAPARRSSPRPPARCSRSPRSTAGSSPSARGLAPGRRSRRSQLGRADREL